MRAPQAGGDDRRAPTSADAVHLLPVGQDESARVGSQLHRLRLRAGFTQEMLAERAGVSVATIGALEQGRRRPHPHTLVVLAEALGLSATDHTALLDLASRSSGPPDAPVPASQGTPQTPTSAARSRLPVPPTVLIGRDAEVAAISAILDPARSAVTLLTLVGPGGVGKSRLVLAAAATLVDVYPDGVVFVDLAPVRDPRLVAASIAQALGLRESDGRSAREALLEYLYARQLLLVLDNFEHLLGAAPLLAQLLQGCPRLVLLVTSRIVLRLRAEQRFFVAPLATPANEVTALEPIATSPAVRLFVERAQTVAPEFALDVSTANAVAAICRQLDGLPLAIELAAARVGLLGPEALLHRLWRRLPLLTGGAADLPERQQTLHHTLAWSHDLLGPAEQVLFRRLAVFAGGWTVEAAETVCGTADLPRGEVVERLGTLIDASLVHPVTAADGVPRFDMLETIREYAAERLEAAGETTAVWRRHLDWCLALVQPIVPAPPDPRQIARLAPEYDNLRTALRRAIDSAAVEEGLWLGAALWMPWYVRGSYAEGRAWLTELLALPAAGADTLARTHALIAAGHLAYCQGEYATAELLLEDGRALADRLGDERLAAAILEGLGNVARAHGDLAGARSLYESALALFQQVHDRLAEATVLGILASVMYERGDVTQAEACAEASLAFFTANGNTWGLARSLYALAGVAATTGDHARARALHESILALHDDLGDPQGRAWSLIALANEVVRDGETGAARQMYTESLALADKAGDRLTQARSLEGLAALLATDRPAQAVRLAGAADAAREVLGAAAHPAERHQLEAGLSAARRVLGAAVFSSAWTAGHALGLAHAVAEARRV